MALVIWDKAYSVGVEALDADHIVLMSLMNHVDDAKRHGSDETAVGAVVRALIAAARRHFRREEALMRAHGFPELEPHINEHRLLEDQLAELHAAYERTPDPQISREIMELIQFWLSRHILSSDIRYRPYLEPADAAPGAD